MTKRLQVYKCNICGSIVEVLHEGVGQLVCCDQPMKLFEAKTEEEGKEKHLPMVEKAEKGFLVKVGSIQHPMEEKHYIEWVEAIANGKAYRQFLKPGNAPEAMFDIETDNVKVREYCSIHGLWTT